MATLLSNNNRLQVTVLVSEEELSRRNNALILRCAMEDMAESVLQKLLNDCTKVEPVDANGYCRLHLDVYVFNQAELSQLISKALTEGRNSYQSSYSGSRFA